MSQKSNILLVAFLCMSTFAYSQSDAQVKLDNMKYYLSVIKEYSQSMRYYADSIKIVQLLDQMDEITLSLEDEVNKIVVPEVIDQSTDTNQEMPEKDPEVSNEEKTNTEMNPTPKFEDYEKESSGSALSKMLPFKNKFNTSIKFQFGINSLIKSKNPAQGILSPEIATGGSWYWDIALVRKARLGGKESKFALNYGIGYLKNTYKIENDLRLVTNSQNKPEFIAIPEVKDHPVINTGHINIPLSLTIAVSKKVKFDAGGYLGYRVTSSQKISLKINNELINEHRRSAYNFNNWVYGTHFAVDVSGFDLIFRYNMSKLFKDSSTHDMNTWMIGTSFSLF